MRGDTLEQLIKANEKRSIQIVEEIDEDYGINPVLFNDIEYANLLFFIKKLAKREKRDGLEKKMNYLGTKEEMKSLNIIARRVEDENILELLKTKDVKDRLDGEELFKEMLEVEA